MRTGRMIAFAMLTIILMSVLSLPLGFAKQPNLHGPQLAPSKNPTGNLFAASNPSGSCASLKLQAPPLGSAQLAHGQVYVSLQKARPNSSFNVTVVKLGNGENDKSWVCGSSSQNIGSITTDQLGNGAISNSFKASSGQSYVVELLDAHSNVIYATYSIAM